MEATGYTSLFLMAFLAATILPLSSEIALTGLLATGEFSASALLLVATLGNSLGSLLNWWLGGWCLHFQDRRWFPVSKPTMEKAQNRYQRWGVWSLLLSWMPVIGDPLTFVAGMMRTKLIIFIPMVMIAKAGRYFVVYLVTTGLLS